MLQDFDKPNQSFNPALMNWLDGLAVYLLSYLPALR